MQLTKPWQEFNSQISRFINQGLEIQSSSKGTSTESELEILKSKLEEWTDLVVDYLNESFGTSVNEYSRDFKHAGKNSFKIPGQQKSLDIQIKEEQNCFRSRINNLEYNLKILSIADAIVRPDEVDLAAREGLDTDEILDLLVSKLYDLYDDNYYPIKNILEVNGVHLSRTSEDRELGHTLENLGLVSLQNTRVMYAQLTVEGKLRVERSRKSQKPDYSTIPDDQHELNNRINEIFERLEQLGVGQQVIFEEIEDLRNLYPKLTKKNWGELLKGKVIDLGLSKVISIETARFIFNKLTDQGLNLL